MWLMDGAEGVPFHLANLRTKIKRKGGGKSRGTASNDAASERVDWEFVGFPPSSQRNAAEEARKARRVGSSTLRLHRRVPVPTETSSSRTHGGRHRRSQSEIYYCSSSHRRPTFNDSTITTTTSSIQRVVLPSEAPVPPPRNKRRPYSDTPPAVPPHMHGNGIPIPLPKSPPTPPRPPHAAPIYSSVKKPKKKLKRTPPQVGAAAPSRVISDQTSPGGTYRSSLRCLPPSSPSPRRRNNNFHSSTLPSWSSSMSSRRTTEDPYDTVHHPRSSADSPPIVIRRHCSPGFEPPSRSAVGTSSQARAAPALPPPSSGAVGKGGSLHDLRSRDSKGDEGRGTLR